MSDSYQRVIPRDLFNEANLLKCYGQIYINLETAGLPHVRLEHDGDSFWIYQFEDDGSTTIRNIDLWIGHATHTLYRPMNSREPWPLVMMMTGGGELLVFTEHGTFSEEFLNYARNSK